MLSGMDAIASGPRVFTLPRYLPALLAGIGGCLFLVIDTSPVYQGAGLPPFINTPGTFEPHSLGWLYLTVPIVATVAGLLLLRWWPYLLVLAGLLSVPGTGQELTQLRLHVPLVVHIAATAG